MLVDDGWLTPKESGEREQARISGEGSVTGGQSKNTAATPAKIA